ncbi:MarR family transcriptional regulator [Sulfitobacter sp. 1151]|uniref:MarR family transcriptional regulator n=2 Tax=Parasulfitobacter algicola TaxID=2614809 RepID=A0ABX2IP08_9RHOB|nr:MarR family transcriptional regulator [Sulfitobacter algicola]
MSKSSRYRLHRSLGYQLTLASRLQEKFLDEKLKSLGLTRTTWCILLAINNENLCYPSDIANFVGIDRTSTSRALRQMENDGLIARKAGIDDKRTTKVEICDSGKALVQKGTPFAIENNARMQAKLADGEIATLHALLQKLHQGEDISLNRF